ncbi:BMP family ABC transporter substrate-binding protein [Bacillus massilinigeriensis]|uniref:BMP family ABC transporter substrate-binding protein n=1 Tax=Bacillus mediterraneensis TaxID=1805474 RepID=UPI0008F8E4E7|nr:BMP family ABC transporter substrate-binding protein [Bacillus mediterraneensis]
MGRKSIFLILLCMLLISGCDQPLQKGKIDKVGLLVPETINDQVWGTKGYHGLLKIHSYFDADVFYEEGVDSLAKVEKSVEDFHKKGVNLVFGHGNEYAEYFNRLSSKYPDMHFISFNGDAKMDNTTSLNFEAYAMGFFGGMVAGHCTKSNKISILAAYEWQPEVEGFYEGVIHERPEADVDIRYVGHWDDDKRAMEILEDAISDGADIIYPAGDGYNVPVIEKAKEKGLYVIGYISDQSDLGKSMVLTSTVQHVDELYLLAAKRYNEGKLESGNFSFDFKDGVISMGKFSPKVDKGFKEHLRKAIKKYEKTGVLPSS